MELTSQDNDLIKIAKDTVENYGDDSLHTVGAALLVNDGTIYTGVNVFAHGGGADAELIVLGQAISQGNKDYKTIVAVGNKERGVIPPCGVCRQLLLDYAPDIFVITEFDGNIQKVKITELLPKAYASWFTKTRLSS